jgi:hypothetical protein
VNEEKNAAREQAIQSNTRGAKKAYKLTRTKERRLFRKKARQLDEEAFIEIERHQDSRKFYKRLMTLRLQALRTICGPKIKNCIYRRCYNALTVTKTSRLRYHMIKRPVDLPQKSLFRPITEIQVGGWGEQR